MSVFLDNNTGRWKHLHTCRHFATTQRHNKKGNNSRTFPRRCGKPGSQFSRETISDVGFVYDVTSMTIALLIYLFI